MRFALRTLKEKDAPLMLEWMHDKSVTENLGADFSSKTQEDARLFIQEAADTNESLHLACVNEQDEYLGTVSLKHIDRKNRRAEYAICFRSAAHGSGASMYATRGILRIAFEELELEKVYLYLYDCNGRANRFYQKAGFVFEGRLRNQVFRNGRFIDEIWYGMIREEWQNSMEHRENNT